MLNKYIRKSISYKNRIFKIIRPPNYTAALKALNYNVNMRGANPYYLKFLSIQILRNIFLRDFIYSKARYALNYQSLQAMLYIMADEVLLAHSN